MWLGDPKLSLVEQEITGIRSTKEVHREPWKETIMIHGTDGGQFHSLIDDKDEKMHLFVSDLMKNVALKYDHTESVSGMDGYFYTNDETFLMSEKEYEPNSVYYNTHGGTNNLTSVYQAPLFATKGHYMDIGESKNLVSHIVDTNGKLVEADPRDDQVYMIVEPISGTSLAGA